MKLILQIIALLTAFSSFAQPTGHQKIFLEITDNRDTIHFKNCFKKNEQGRKTNLVNNIYQLNDISDNPTGFEFYPRAEFIHKTLMTSNHHIQIIKNKLDTMSIEILNAFDLYFLNIPFKNGNFRLSINDGNLHKWNYNTLRYKRVDSEIFVYDITPLDWSVFQVNESKTAQDYFISIQFEKQKLLAKPVIPEADPNFRNTRRIKNLRKEIADYNFDGQKDYREHKYDDTAKWNYFIYKDSTNGYVWDTLLSSLDKSYFDFDKNKFLGAKTIRIDSLSTQMNVYEYIDGVVTLVQKRLCVQSSPNSEKINCFVSVLENGKWIDKAPILGPE
jgi:hypothetical protein